MDTYKSYFNICQVAQNTFGYKHTEESLEKMRIFQKGRTAWNKGIKTGQVTWMKGKHHSEEAKRKNREAHTGKKDSAETRIKKQKSAIEGWKLRKSKTILCHLFQ